MKEKGDIAQIDIRSSCMQVGHLTICDMLPFFCLSPLFCQREN